MSDIYCAICNEPWDAYGVRNGDMDKDEAKRFLKGQGCPSCGFGTRCKECSGTGKEPGISMLHPHCALCHDRRLIRVWKKSPNDAHWSCGYAPNVTVLDNAPDKLRDQQVVHHRDGYGIKAMANCPQCAEHAEDCPACNGTGKYTRLHDSDEQRIKFLDSAMESTDDPDEFLDQL